MRRSNVTLRLGGNGNVGIGPDIDDAIFTRRSLIEELLSRQYNPSAFLVKDEPLDETEVGGQGNVTLLLSKWDFKNCIAAASTKENNKTEGNERTPANSNSVRNTNVCYNLNRNVDIESNRSFSMYTGESDNLTITIDEDDMTLDDYEDEEDLDEDDYDYTENDYDDEELENYELAEALRIVRSKKALNINDYRTRFNKPIKRKADSDEQSITVKIGHCQNNVCESKLNGSNNTFKMINIEIDAENLTPKNTKLLEQSRQSLSFAKTDSVAYYKGSLIKGFNSTECDQEKGNHFPDYLEAYGPVDNEVRVYF